MGQLVQLGGLAVQEGLAQTLVLFYTLGLFGSLGEVLYAIQVIRTMEDASGTVTFIASLLPQILALLPRLYHGALVLSTSGVTIYLPSPHLLYPPLPPSLMALLTHVTFTALKTAQDSPPSMSETSLECCEACFFEEGGEGAEYVEVPATSAHPHVSYRVITCDCLTRVTGAKAPLSTDMEPFEACAFCLRSCGTCRRTPRTSSSTPGTAGSGCCASTSRSP